MLQDKITLKTIDKADCHHGLYLLTTTAPHAAIVCSLSSNTWHHRLGHLSPKRLHSMKSVLGLSDPCTLPCHIYPLAKQ